MLLFCFSCYFTQPDSDAIICAEDHKRVSADHYVADQGYGVPTKTSVGVQSTLKYLLGKFPEIEPTFIGGCNPRGFLNQVLLTQLSELGYLTRSF